MTKRLLITGVGGSIGCHVLRHFLKNTDWDVVGIDSFRHKGLTDRVDCVTRKHPETLPRLKIVTHDMMAPISYMLAKKIGPIDYIINLASMSDVAKSLEDPAAAIRSNIEIMLTALNYARAWPVRAFLHVSTDEVYGPADTVDHREWDPILPSSPYSASKAAQEAIAISYWRAFGVPLIITNLMNNFGEMQSSAKFPAIVLRKVARGETVTIHGSILEPGTRYYTHSRNSADAFLFLLKNTTPYRHIDGRVDRPDRYHVVGGTCVSNLEFARKIADFLGVPLHYVFEDFAVTRPGHDRHYGLNGGKLTAMGWRAPMDMETSLRETVAWYTRHPEWLEPR